MQVWLSLQVPEPTEQLDDDGIRFLYKCLHAENAKVVSFNPEIAILWGAHHNLARVSKPGFEQYLAKYISKAEPSCKIDLLENA